MAKSTGAGASDSRAARSLWRNSRKDALLLVFSVAHLVVMIVMAVFWTRLPLWGQLGGLATLCVLTSYNIIVVSHLFTHAPWFISRKLNALVSLLNSVNIGQSVQAYQLTHVRNHHRFNNDSKQSDGTTRDASSTYLRGENGEHAALSRYVLGGAVESMFLRLKEIIAVTRGWRVGPGERNLLTLAASREPRRSRELRQIQGDRAAHCLALAGFVVISWEWTVFCYFPAFFLSLCMVNVQNYFRHYGADPSDRSADSVSHYGRFYNLLTFNDGYHQEHHLSPGTHWSRLPEVRERHRERLDGRPRIISPVPAMLGFLDRRRPLLHRSDNADRSAGVS